MCFLNVVCRAVIVLQQVKLCENKDDLYITKEK